MHWKQHWWKNQYWKYCLLKIKKTKTKTKQNEQKKPHGLLSDKKCDSECKGLDVIVTKKKEGNKQAKHLRPV